MRSWMASSSASEDSTVDVVLVRLTSGGSTDGPGSVRGPVTTRPVSVADALNQEHCLGQLEVPWGVPTPWRPSNLGMRCPISMTRSASWNSRPPSASASA